jgi:opacity protein-like surface antigen
MKKTILMLFLLYTAVALQAQEEGSLLLNTYTSKSFTDKVHFDDTYAKVNQGFQWGAGFEFFPMANKSFELKYLRLATEFPLYTNKDVQIPYQYDSGTLNYVLFGVTNYFGKNPAAKITPYAGLEAGLGLIHREHTRWKFAWGGKLGVKVKATPVFSVNINGYFQSMISSFGSDYWEDTGITYVAPDYTAILQFGVGVVLGFDLAKMQTP